MLFLRVLIFSTLARTSLGDTLITATGNPHEKCPNDEGFEDHSCGLAGGRCVAQDIIPTNIISLPMTTQQDTLDSIVWMEYLGKEIPLYQFKQSPRLTASPLPFKLVLLNDWAKSMLLELPVPEEQARDSWFVGFRWSVIVCVNGGRPFHLGWRFVNDHGEDFLALIVEVAEAERAAPLGARVAEILRIGQKAETWMLAALITAGGKSLPR